MNGVSLSDGSGLGFTDAGTGPPVVFLHPTPLDRDYWRPLTKELAGIRTVVPDLRGHGVSSLGSDLPAGAFDLVPDAPVLSMDQLATDMLALLDQLSLRRAVFVGCSIGGYVMLEIWRRAPERMTGLVFICSKPQPDAPANLLRRAETIQRARTEGVTALFDGRSQTLLSETARIERPEIVAEIRSHMTLTPEAEVAVQAGLAARPDSVSTVSTIRVPILAIAGVEDSSVTPADMEAFRSAPGGCEFHVLPGAGHFAAYEQPRKVAALMAPWLRQFDL
ncbi:MAG: alpha/beta fold hydrolase [Terracidiphilus sp.]|jgi:pimeloyl-ACP methyl ester carboxylesterase